MYTIFTIEQLLQVLFKDRKYDYHVRANGIGGRELVVFCAPTDNAEQFRIFYTRIHPDLHALLWKDVLTDSPLRIFVPLPMPVSLVPATSN